MTDVTTTLEELRRVYAALDITSQIWFISSPPAGELTDIRVGRLMPQGWTTRLIASIATIGSVPYDADEQVAVKCTRVSATITLRENKRLAKDIRRLRQEISVWRRLDHPNVQPLLGLWWPRQELLPATVSRWEEKGNLSTYVDGLMERLPERELRVTQLNLLQGVLDGLTYLHDNEVIHGNLKSENVLISQEGVPLLCDFGIAWTHVQGAPQYMAPELLLVDDPEDMSLYTVASDIWAFGCLASRVFTGDAPYSNKTHVATVIGAVLRNEFFPRPAGMDNSHWALILSCCTFDVDSRPPTTALHHQLRVLQLLLREDLPLKAQTICSEYCTTLQDYNDKAEQDYKDGLRAKQGDRAELAAARHSMIVDGMKKAMERLTEELHEGSLDHLLSDLPS